MKDTNRQDTRPSMQFYVDDWLSDQGLRFCGLAARGLWFDFLCIMWKSKPRGFLINDKAEPQAEKIALLVGVETADVVAALANLEAHEVFSRNEKGAIYCRRMVREWSRREAKARAGKKGGSTKHNYNTIISEMLSRDGVGEGVVSEDILNIYNLYPKKSSKRSAVSEIVKAVAFVMGEYDLDGLGAVEYLMEATGAYREATSKWPKRDLHWIPDPERWYKRGKYDDDRSKWERKSDNPNTEWDKGKP